MLEANSWATPGEIYEALETTAIDMGKEGFDFDSGDGLVQADLAVSAISSGNTPPTADFSYVTNDLTVTFTDASKDHDGTVGAWNWSFGDGNESYIQNPDHTYAASGTYTVTLTVTDDDGGIDTTSQGVTVSDPDQINAPTDLSAVVDGNTVTLDWIDTSNNEKGFKVERAIKTRGKYVFDVIDDTNATSYSDNVAPGTYKYRICAFAGATYSDYSNEVLVKVEATAPDPGTLYPPSDLKAKLDGSTVTLTWTDNSSDEEGFYIERGIRTAGKIKYVPIGTVDPNVTTFLDDVYTLSGTYYYKVRAYNEKGTSDYCKAVTVRIKK